MCKALEVGLLLINVAWNQVDRICVCQAYFQPYTKNKKISIMKMREE
jgi:hypothetical protein